MVVVVVVVVVFILVVTLAAGSWQLGGEKAEVSWNDGNSTMTKISILIIPIILVCNNIVKWKTTCPQLLEEWELREN
jgi:hypothetical protein